MTIQAVNNVAFKGLIRGNNADKEVSTTLETDKILDIATRNYDRKTTIITYDYPQIVKHNGYQREEPLVMPVKHDMDTILKAYSAAKNSNLCVDLREYND